MKSLQVSKPGEMVRFSYPDSAGKNRYQVEIRLNPQPQQNLLFNYITSLRVIDVIDEEREHQNRNQKVVLLWMGKKWAVKDKSKDMGKLLDEIRTQIEKELN